MCARKEEHTKVDGGGDMKTTKKHLNCVSLRIFIFGYTDFKYLLAILYYSFLSMFSFPRSLPSLRVLLTLPLSHFRARVFLVFCYFHPLILLFYVY